MDDVELFTKLLKKTAEFKEGKEKAVFERAANDLERSLGVVAKSK